MPEATANNNNAASPACGRYTSIPRGASRGDPQRIRPGPRLRAWSSLQPQPQQHPAPLTRRSLVQVSLTCIVLYWMSFQVAFARKKFNVLYPKLYAEGDSEDAQRFNCVQRGHQNSLELAPQAFVCQLLMGLKFPIAAAILGVAWAIGRIIYFNGYASGEPKGRIKGGIVAGLVWIALVLGTGYAGYVMYSL